MEQAPTVRRRDSSRYCSTVQSKLDKHWINLGFLTNKGHWPKVVCNIPNAITVVLPMYISVGMREDG